jgi:C-terminal processing protease CtpA/Prc
VPAGDETAPDSSRFVGIRSYKYKFEGKTILLVRIPGFMVPQSNYDENVGWLGALLKENLGESAPATGAPAPSLQDTPADVVVLDVTHNPGGAAPYVQGLATLFATTAIPNAVQESRADRLWISNLVAQANYSDASGQSILLERIKAVESAYDRGDLLAPFMPLSGSYQGPTVAISGAQAAGAETLDPHPLVQWRKPVMVLHDELSGSGGDAFPLILQNSGIKTFGARTAGMGGSVVPVLTLPHSGAELRLTRGLFGVHNAQGSMTLIENNGVTPSFPYEHTIADYRAGFVGYATAFSKVATTITR